MPFDAEGFNRSAALPPELKIGHIREAIEHVEDRAAELIDIYLEQANVFSGIVGIMGLQALHNLTPYKKHKHPDVAQQRFPDLSLRGKPIPRPSTHWNLRVQPACGPCNPTTIIQAGTSCGGTRWIRRDV